MDEAVATEGEPVFTTSSKPQPQKNPHGKVKLTPHGEPKPKDPKNFVTPRGMEFGLEFDKHYGLYTVVLKSPGQLPKELKGKFTEEKRAKEAIARYLDNYWKGRV